MSPMNRLHSGSDTTLFNLQAMACLLIGLCIADVARLNGITSPTLGSAALLINGAICVSIALHFFPRLIGLGAGSLSLHALLGGLLLVLFKQHRLDAPALATLGSTTSPGLIYEALAIGALGVTAAWLHWRGLLRWRATLGFLFTSLAYQLLTKSPEPNAVIMHGIALALMPHLFATLQTTPAHPRGTWLLGAVGGLYRHSCRRSCTADDLTGDKDASASFWRHCQHTACGDHDNRDRGTRPYASDANPSCSRVTRRTLTELRHRCALHTPH
jgi:hypothetical protein